MSFEGLAAFWAMAALFAIIPGPDFAYIISSARSSRPS